MSEPLIINEFYFTTKAFSLDIKDYLVRIDQDLSALVLSGPDVKLLQYVTKTKDLILSYSILTDEKIARNNIMEESPNYKQVESIYFENKEVITENNVSSIKIPPAIHWHHGSLDIFSTIMQHVTHISRISCKDVHTDCIIDFPDFKLFMLWVTSTNKTLLERHTGKDVTALFSEALKQCQN